MTTGHREVVWQAAPASAIRERNRDHRFFTGMALAADLTAVEDRKALRLLDGELVELLVPSEVLWTLERARVAERLGERETAARDYQYVVNVWRRADAQLQPYVAEAREGLRRVSGELQGLDTTE
jgi:hypothetical protein